RSRRRVVVTTSGGRALACTGRAPDRPAASRSRPPIARSRPGHGRPRDADAWPKHACRRRGSPTDRRPGAFAVATTDDTDLPQRPFGDLRQLLTELAEDARAAGWRGNAEHDCLALEPALGATW